MTDEELISSIIHDKQLFGAVVERYEQKLRRYIKRLGVHQHEDQSDVLQDIFIKVYRNANAFDTKLKFSSWIYRIAHNEAISWYRKRSVRPEGHLVADSEELLQFAKGALVEESQKFDEQINADIIHDALLQLPGKYKEVILLRYFEYKEYDEISDILKIPAGSVGTLLHRGKKKLLRAINTDKIRI